MSGAEPWTGLEHGRVHPLRVDVARRRDADRARAGGPQIRQDVAEQVGGHHHVEPVRVQDEMRGQDVDVVLVPPDVRIGLGHRLHPLVPVRHGDRDAVRLRGRGQVLLRALLGQLEGEFQDPIGPVTGHDRLLQGEFPVGAGEHPAARVRVLALGVLADHPEVDIARLAVGERALHPGISRTGRRLAYWSNSRRNRIREPQREMWSGTRSGMPTAPK